MHNNLVTYIQSNHAADGIEVRSVGPRAVTLAFPPELHDLGNICGELELRFNARIDLLTSDQPGIGPTATVWVRQGDAGNPDESPNSREPSQEITANSDSETETPQVIPPAKELGSNVEWNWRRPCQCASLPAVAASLTALAAIATIVAHSTTIWSHVEL